MHDIQRQNAHAINPNYQRELVAPWIAQTIKNGHILSASESHLSLFHRKQTQNPCIKPWQRLLRLSASIIIGLDQTSHPCGVSARIDVCVSVCMCVCVCVCVRRREESERYGYRLERLWKGCLSGRR